MQTVDLYTTERRSVAVPYGANSIETQRMDFRHCIQPINDDTPVFPDHEFSRERYPIVRLCRGGPDGVEEWYVAMDNRLDWTVWALADVKKRDYEALTEQNATLFRHRSYLRNELSEKEAKLQSFKDLSFWGRLRWLVTGALPEGG